MARTKQTRSAVGAQVESKQIYERVSAALVAISIQMLEHVRDSILAQMLEDLSEAPLREQGSVDALHAKMAQNDGDMAGVVVLLDEHAQRRVDALHAKMLQTKRDLAMVIALLDGGQEDDTEFEYLNQRGIALTEEIEGFKMARQNEREASEASYRRIDDALLRVAAAAKFRASVLAIHEKQVELLQKERDIAMVVAFLEMGVANANVADELNQSGSDLTDEVDALEKEKTDEFVSLDVALACLERLDGGDYTAVVHEARARVLPLLLTEDTHRRHARTNGTNADSAHYALQTGRPVT